MDLITRAIALFDAPRALKRARHLQAMQVMARYDAAAPSRRLDAWRATENGPNAEIRPQMKRLRNLSRDLVRNNPHARRAVDVLVAAQIGYGITPRAKTGDAALDRAVNAAWAEWSARCDADGLHDFAGIQALVARTRAESGEALVRLVRVGRELRLQVIEPDQLDEFKDGLVDGVDMVAGVEFDQRGQRAAYWLLDRHPGEVDYLRRRTGTSRRVRASDVLHLYRAERPGQVRGVPDLASVMTRLRQLDEYTDAAVEQAKVQACLGVFVESSLGPSSSTLGQAAPAGADGSRREYVSPGMVAYLAPGEKVSTLTPSGHGAFEPYALHQLMSIAVGFGVPYHALTGDLRQANYSSLRAGDLPFRRMVEMDQWLMLIPRLCVPVWEAFIAHAIDRGILQERPEGYPVRWQTPRVEALDPDKDAEAWLKRVRTGQMTWSQGVAAEGYDPEEQADEIAADARRFDARGVVVDADPRRVNRQGGAQDARQLAAVDLAANGRATPQTEASYFRWLREVLQHEQDQV